MDRQHSGSWIQQRSQKRKPLRNYRSGVAIPLRRGSHSRKNSNSGKLLASQKPGKVNVMSAPLEDAIEHSRESWDNKAMYKAGHSIDNKMSDAIQHRLDIRKIYQRLENFNYNGGMELCSDVQLMLKGAIQYYGFSREVRTEEARKVHDLFFDLLKATLPEIDFREARSAVSFSGHAASSSAPSSRQILAGQGERQKQANEVDLDHSHSQKQLSPVSHANEDTQSRSHMPQRETRFGSSNSNKESGQHEDSRHFAHPGELVICKKKRKDREKSVVKSGNGSASQVSPDSNNLSIWQACVNIVYTFFLIAT
ncbi:Bromo domain-containing protein [Heracleum sosnowskyi]|uniref:Bromo domain-containing protein n=1 Tax=Heracleum sosnowskyi TaxID=360622 RepID=A0AAD8I353_9APIA|nr:Bromo domain-containing protein [Heracleum sosnowskyi]